MSDTPGAAAGKGRPTPKRRDAQRTRGGPVAPPPKTRREAARRVRAEAATKRKAVKAGTHAGEERHFLPRDAGPVRAYVRDLIDSRRHIGVLLLPAALLPLLAQFTHSQAVLAIATTLWLATLGTALGDFVVTGFLIRRRVGAKFPAETKMRGHVLYGIVRTAQFRRFRLPPPRVSAGDPV